MWEAFAWAFVASMSLVLGALIAFYVPIPKRARALVMAFGAGVLIAAVAFELTEDAFTGGGGDAVAIGLVAGALTFYFLNILVNRKATPTRKSPAGPGSEASARAVALGAGLDGVPESVVIGLSLLDGHGGVSVAIIAAVFISNVPESIAATTGFLRAGRKRSRILILWGVVVLISSVSAALGYGLIGNGSDYLVALMQAFAAGALLTMLSDTLLPDAYRDGGNLIGVATAIGFAAAFLLSTID